MSHPNNTIASYIYVTLLRCILFSKEQPSLTSLLQVLQETINEVDKLMDADIRLAIIQGVEGTKRDVTGKSKGWVLHGLYSAIYSLFHCKSVTECCSTIIGMGGDRRRRS